MYYNVEADKLLFSTKMILVLLISHPTIPYLRVRERNMNALYICSPFHSPLQAQKRSDISALLLLEIISQFSWICFHIDSTCILSPQEVQHYNTTTPREYGHMIMPSKPTS